MSNRETLRQLESEGAATPSSPPNPLADFALRIAEGALIAYVEYRDKHATDDVDDIDRWARAKAIGEVAEALESYGIVQAYPKLVAAANEAKIVVARCGVQDVTYRLCEALVLAEQSLVVDSDGLTAKVTDEDVPL